MLVRCLYASRAVKPITDPVVDGILRQSRKNNPRAGITGMLCFADEVFVQVLEGGRTDVCRLLATIFRDERHTDVQILSFEEVSERKFGNWTMGQVNIASVNPALLLKYSERPRLDPSTASGAAILALLLEIADTGAIHNRAG